MPENSFFKEIEIPQQKHYSNKGGIVFPRVLFPLGTSSVLTKAVQEHKSWLESLLHQSGALLFRGFPLTTASDFNDFVEAFGFEELPYVGGAAPRTNVVGRVFTANESPPDQKITFHHEMAQVLTFTLPYLDFAYSLDFAYMEIPIPLLSMIYIYIGSGIPFKIVLLL